ncbi:EAL and HDOD domain-containing protein [Cellulomonas soli]
MTTGIFTGRQRLTPPASGLLLEIPLPLAMRDDAVALASALRGTGQRLVLGDYSGTASQDALLPYVDHVKLDTARSADRIATLVERAHHSGAGVIGERADTRERIRLAREIGIDLLQGPMFERNHEVTGRDFTAGELQCLELMQLLSADSVDQAAVVRMVGSDPELAIRVLHLVNSSSYGMRSRVDSVHQAVVLVGPQQLAALAMASLIDARPTTVGALWAVLTRAQTVRALAGSDAGYTVGLLSAVAAQQHYSVDDLVRRTGVSDDIAQALRTSTGPYGPALAAVLAHEENDVEGVIATGLEPFDVAHTYLAAVPEALATATALAISSNG